MGIIGKSMVYLAPFLYHLSIIITDRYYVNIAPIYPHSDLLSSVEQHLDCRRRNALHDSVQSPYDPECSYRRKAGQQVKGYRLNVTETIEDDQLNLITDIQLESAHCGDADFVDPSITQTEKLTGDQVDICYADGAYNRSLEHEAGDEKGYLVIVLSGIQGAPSRFELDETSDSVVVTDTQTSHIYQGIPVRRRDPDAATRWRITLEDGTYRSFGQREIRASNQRRMLAEEAFVVSPSGSSNAATLVR